MSQVTVITRATIGRTVHLIGKSAESNGATVAPGIITRVWGEPTAGGVQLVNVTMFPDHAHPDLVGSVHLYPSAAAAQDAVSGVTDTLDLAAFWPERV